MRELIIERINQIKLRESGFATKLMRWKPLKHNGLHISKVEFDKLENSELLGLYEKILKAYYAQM